MLAMRLRSRCDSVREAWADGVDLAAAEMRARAFAQQDAPRPRRVGKQPHLQRHCSYCSYCTLSEHHRI